MTANTSPNFTTVPPHNGYQAFVNGDSTTVKNLFVAGANGSQIHAINATTSDTVADTIQLFQNNGTSYLIDTVQIPASSGNLAAAHPSATPPINLLSGDIASYKILNSTQRVIQLGANETLQGGMTTAVTSCKTATIVIYGEDF